jgi:hypothetical protein
MSYGVMVDENYHYADPERRWELGTFDTADTGASGLPENGRRRPYESRKPGMAADAVAADTERWATIRS